MALMSLEDEIRYFAKQGYTKTGETIVMFYGTSTYERGPITVEDHFYVIEKSPNGAVTYVFFVNTEAEARAHKLLRTSAKFMIFQVRPEEGRSARRVANFYNSQEIRTDGRGGLPVGWCYAYGPVGFWREETQYG